MSTIVVVKKNGLATIAADTLTTFGNTKESAEYIVNSEKIFKHNENYLGITGSASLEIAVQDFLMRTKKKVSFENAADIFRFGLLLHKELKETYYLRPDDEEDFETFRGDILIANPNGIFGLSSYRFVQEFSKFYPTAAAAFMRSAGCLRFITMRIKTAKKSRVWVWWREQNLMMLRACRYFLTLSN